MSFKILIIGGGGREHALGWKLAQSPKIEKIFIAPGNAGTAQVGENVDIKVDNFDKLIELAKKEKVDLTVVGPDDSLAAGIVDAFQNQGLKIWGPSKKAAQIEASKTFAKELMQTNRIPTAEYKVFTQFDEAVKYVEPKLSPPAKEGGTAGSEVVSKIVIKASGLALGKGVIICKNLDEAKAALKAAMIDKIFGEAGGQVIIEEFLQGIEFSAHAFSDGRTFQLLPASQDHKAVFDGGLGPNTGGMGTIAPVPWVDQKLMNEIASRVVKPALDGLKKVDAPFVGLLYPGMMASPSVFAKTSPFAKATEDKSADDLLSNKQMWIKVLEFNARFGDPETQSYMRLLKTDLFDILMACVDGKLDEITIEWENKYACCIVLASGGYPGKYEKGKKITGVDEAGKLNDIVIFHAGTKKVSNQLLTNGLPAKALATAGGRVLGVTAVADDLKTALDKAYAAVKLIHFEGMHFRTDIGLKSLTVVNSKL